jgi:hypothetical protein
MEVTVNIPEVLASKAKESGVPADVYVEKLLDKLAAASIDLDRDRERLRGELTADWDHYRTTGLHLDEEEVDAWLARLENGHTEDPPALHV